MKRQVNQRFLTAMIDMGIPLERAELALCETGNVGVEVCAHLHRDCINKGPAPSCSPECLHLALRMGMVQVRYPPSLRAGDVSIGHGFLGILDEG